MELVAVEFATWVDQQGYQSGGDKGELIIQRSGEYFTCQPLEMSDRLYSEFAKLDGTPESFIGFMDRYGPLTANGYGQGQSIQELRFMKNWVQGLIDVWQSDPKNIGNLYQASDSRAAVLASGWDNALTNITSGQTEIDRISLPLDIENAATRLRDELSRDEKSGKFVQKIIPETLWDAIKFQIRQQIAKGVQIKICEQCGDWFPTSKDGRARRGKFCSTKCRVHHHRSKK